MAQDPPRTLALCVARRLRGVDVEGVLRKRSTSLPARRHSVLRRDSWTSARRSTATSTPPKVIEAFLQLESESELVDPEKAPEGSGWAGE